MPRRTAPPSDSYEEIAEIMDSLKCQMRLGLETALEAEIVANLLEGKRTIGDLVEVIYNRRGDDPEFHRCYMRVYRALQRLGRKGYVSRKLFGSEKPYRLTSLAFDQLASVRRRDTSHLVDPSDGALLVGTIVMAVVTALASKGDLRVSRQVFTLIYSLFVFLSGASSLRLVQMVRKVW